DGLAGADQRQPDAAGDGRIQVGVGVAALCRRLRVGSRKLQRHGRAGCRARDANDGDQGEGNRSGSDQRVRSLHGRKGSERVLRGRKARGLLLYDCSNPYETWAPSRRRSLPPKSCGEKVGEIVISTRVRGPAGTLKTRVFPLSTVQRSTCETFPSAGCLSGP